MGKGSKRARDGERVQSAQLRRVPALPALGTQCPWAPRHGQGCSDLHGSLSPKVLLFLPTGSSDALSVQETCRVLRHIEIWGLENQHLNFSSPCSFFLALSSSFPATTAKHQHDLGIHREAETPGGNPVFSPASRGLVPATTNAGSDFSPYPNMKLGFCRQAAGRDGMLEG